MLSSTEGALRGRAKSRGYRLIKSKFRVDNSYNFGRYMLVDDDSGHIILGLHFDAELHEIEEYLA